ncbi:iron-only hydrogenase system regulator, partial [Anaerotruncus colihominis]
PSAADRINAVLHEYAPYIVGRMGIPYRQKEVCIISVVINAPGDLISALSGKLGMLGGVSIKTVYSKVPAGEDPGACAG